MVNQYIDDKTYKTCIDCQAFIDGYNGANQCYVSKLVCYPSTHN